MKSNNKVIIAFGTRPEYLKLWPLSMKLKENYKVINVCSGQHKNILSMQQKKLKLKVNYNLNIMRNNQSLNYTLSKSIFEFDKIFKIENPDLVIVQGDTNTTLSAAIAASNLKIKIAHIEAGLRTYDKFNPFPEETNRQLISKLVDIHFTHSKFASLNLIKEGIHRENIFNVGNTIIDTLKFYLKNTNVQKKKFDFKKKTILITCHRRENFHNLDILYTIILNLIDEFKDLTIIIVKHPNPTLKKVYAKLSKIKNIKLIKSMEYFEFIDLAFACDLIISDSGGIQEEITLIKKPLLIIRNKTERQEILKSNYVKLTGFNSKLIKFYIKKFLFGKKFKIKNFMAYGYGNSSKKINDILKKL